MTKTATAVRIPTARRGPAGTSHGTFRRDVEGLRAVAVALIVLFDAGVPGLGGGYVGVDVFFAISGYLITSLLQREADTTGRISLIDFYGRRARRILPMACLVLIVVLPASRHWLGFLRADQIASDSVWAVLFAANFHFAASPLQHYGSLAVEGQFYLVWPTALVLLVALTRRFAAQRTVPFTLGCAVGGSLAWSVLHAGSWAHFSPVTRAWEFGAGALLALAGNDRHRIPHRLAAGLSWFGLSLILASALVYRPGTPFPGIAATAPVLGTVLVLAGRGEGLLGLPPLQWLGRISYSLALWHWPVLMIAEDAHGGALPGAARGLLVLVSVGLAATAYVLVERPIRLNPRLRSSPALTLAASLLLIAAPLLVAWWTLAAPPADAQFLPYRGAPIAHVQP
jgi:peptidoglycan/LPS O-acetylase OafA/YrhL